MRRWSALLLVCLLAPATAHAADPPQVIGFYADPHVEGNQDAREVFVQGEALFAGEDPVTVGMDPQHDAQRRELGLFGMDARNLAIWQPTIVDQTLWFAMSLWDLQVVAAEAASWRWTFLHNGVPYQLEAFRGGLTAGSTYEGSPDLITGSVPPADRFRLLGPCSTVMDTLRCGYNRSVTGQIDMNSDRVIWKVPLELPFEIGSVFAPHPAGAVAAFGGVFTDTVTQTASYTALDRRVLISIRQPNGGATVLPPRSAFVSDLLVDGRTPFYANLIVDTLNRGLPGPETPYEVVALACAGLLCGTPAVTTIRL